MVNQVVVKILVMGPVEPLNDCLSEVGGFFDVIFGHHFFSENECETALFVDTFRRFLVSGLCGLSSIKDKECPVLLRSISSRQLIYHLQYSLHQSQITIWVVSEVAKALPVEYSPSTCLEILACSKES